MIVDYAIYLRRFLKGNHGNVYLRLTEFIDTGRIKDTITRKASDKTKIAILNEMGRSIRHFLRNQDSLMGIQGQVYNVDVKTYEEFCLPIERDNKLKELGI